MIREVLARSLPADLPHLEQVEVVGDLHRLGDVLVDEEDGHALGARLQELGVVPGTIYARFGTKDELLVQLYIQTLDGVSDLLDGFEVTPAVTVADAVRAIDPSVGRLQRDFGTYFDAYPPGRESVREATWARLQSRFQRMSRKLHATISQNSGA